MLRSYKKWLLCLGGIFLLPTAAIVVFNWVVDPLWFFSHVNRFNEKAVIIDQRQQKTNRLRFGSRDYTAILIGSSRTESIDAAEIGGWRAFNFAAPAMYPEEYGDYIAYARRINRVPISGVFIGMDFYGSSVLKPIPIKPPQGYFLQTDETLYRFKTVTNPDTLRIYIKKKFDYKYYYLYDRHNYTLIPKDLAKYDIGKLRAERLDVFKKHFYSNDSYQYNEKFKKICRTLLTENSDVSFVVFTTPVTQPLFELMVTEGRFNDYCRWLQELVEVFGGVYNFMDLNTITTKLANYYDADHFFPSVGTLVAHRISGMPDPRIPTDFGVYVTNDNLEQHLTNLRYHANQILNRNGR